MSNITLCYKNNKYPLQWECESGFESVKAADKRAFELRERNLQNITTTLFPFNKYTPLWVQKYNIKYHLSNIEVPIVNMKK